MQVLSLPEPAIERWSRRPATRRLATMLVLLAVWGAGGAVLLAVALQPAVPVRDLLVDASTARGSAWYAGFVTSIGVLAWAAAAGACAAAAYAAGLLARPGAVRAFRGAAALFAVLLLDDLFLLHSNLVPDLLGVPKVGVLAGLGGLALAWALPNWHELWRTRWELLLAAGSAFALSLSVDVLVPGPEAGLRVLVEDGAKFLGVLALAAWSVVSARDVIRSLVTEPRPTTPTRHLGSTIEPWTVDASPLHRHHPTGGTVEREVARA